MKYIPVEELLKNNSVLHKEIKSKIISLKTKKLTFENLNKRLISEYGISLLVPEELEYLKKVKRLIWHLENNMISIPKCYSNGCQNQVKFHQTYYGKFCSVKCSNSHPETIKNIEKTSLRKYGVKRPSQSLQSKDKLKKTNLEKFGYISSSMHPDIKEKAKKTCIQKYGTVSTAQQFLKNKELYYDKEFILKTFFNSKNEFLLHEFQSFFNCGQPAASTQLKRLNIDYSKKVGSRIQEEIVDYIKSIYSGKVIENDRTILEQILNQKLELDIYIPDLKIAFEINGVYWHSYGKNNTSLIQGDLNFNKTRHLVKTEACEKLGIQLIHISDTEYIKKKNIYRSVIRNKLGLCTVKFYARKLSIKEISSTEAKEFLNNNHLQGYTKASISIGLFLDKTLISIGTFSKMRFQKERVHKDFELIRLASIINTSCIGCGSKIIKYFIRNYLGNGILYSFANRFWSMHTRNIYSKIGFIKIKNTKPNHIILQDTNLLNSFPRQKFQKHKLKDIPNFIYDKNKTTIKNIIDNNYRIIWDSGNIKYKISKENI
jgi:hypothetical protein